MLQKLVRKLRERQNLINALGRKEYRKFHTAAPGEQIVVSIDGMPITIRKKTPDLEVALSSLRGEFDCLKYLFEEGFTGTIIDAGGYIGAAAIAISKIYPAAKVISIEPSSRNFLLLEQNLRDHHNIKALKAALTAKESPAVKLRNRKTGAWGYTTISEPKDQPNAEEIEEVPTVSLSSIIADHGPISMMKIDIEGAERDLFRYNHEELSSVPVIFVELHDRIVQGCTEQFKIFSRDRWIVKCSHEKYLSLRCG